MGGVPRTNRCSASLLVSLVRAAVWYRRAFYRRCSSSNGRSVVPSVGHVFPPCDGRVRVRKRWTFRGHSGLLAGPERAVGSVKLEQREASRVPQIGPDESLRAERGAATRLSKIVREKDEERSEDSDRLNTTLLSWLSGVRATSTDLACCVQPQRRRGFNDRASGRRDSSFATWRVQAEEGAASRISTSEIF